MSTISPRVDIAFKKIFGVHENKDLLISLINSIVSEEDQVVDITLLNPYNEKSFREDKLSILDIKAMGSEGKRFNIEIQITDEADYDKRALYYWAKLYTDQLKNSDDYSNLNKVIGIHILNFISIPEAQKYHNVFQITEKEGELNYFKDLELHTIELKKFTDGLGKEFEEIASHIHNALDLWSAFLTRHDLLNPEHLSQNLSKAELEKALGVLKVMNFSEEEREAYDSHLKWLRVEANTLKKAEEKGLAKGMKKGIEQGIEQGIVQGIEQGIEQGIVQGRDARSKEIAKALIKEMLPLQKIAELTTLSIEEIQTLQKD